jgi:hypothetical protein
MYIYVETAVPEDKWGCKPNAAISNIGEIMYINLLAPKFYIQILAHPVCKMWITQEPKKVALRNKRNFEEKNGECAACLTHCGRVTKISVFNTVKLGTSASSP